MLVSAVWPTACAVREEIPGTPSSDAREKWRGKCAYVPVIFEKEQSGANARAMDVFVVV
jgi:hypothetical protein